MIKKVIKIFEKCYFCPFLKERHIKDVTEYRVDYLCRKGSFREIDKKDLKIFPDWCPLEDETIVDFTKGVTLMDKINSTKRCG